MDKSKITPTPVEKKPKIRTSNKWLWSMLAIFLGLLVGWVILLAVNGNPVDYYQAIILGNFGSSENFYNFLGTLSWMLLIGLSMVVSFRAGIFNIGSVGQMIAGGIAGYAFASMAQMGRSGVIFSILIPCAVGTGVAWVIGYLKVRFNIHEVVSSIMINWSIYWFYKFVTNPQHCDWFFSSPTAVNTNPVLTDNSLRFSGMQNSSFNIMFIIAIVLVIVFFVLYTRTRWGVKQDIIGKSTSAAKYSGINRDRELVKTMMISGALAGLAGGAFYLGVNQNLPTIGSDIPAEGFNGITIALIGFNGPLGSALGAVFVSMMYNARPVISATTNPYISDLILGLIVWFVAIVNFFIIYRPQDKFFSWMDGNRDKLFTQKIHSKTEKEIIKELDAKKQQSTIDSKTNDSVNNLAIQQQKISKSSNRMRGEK